MDRFRIALVAATCLAATTCLARGAVTFAEDRPATTSSPAARPQNRLIARFARSDRKNGDRKAAPWPREAPLARTARIDGGALVLQTNGELPAADGLVPPPPAPPSEKAAPMSAPPLSVPNIDGPVLGGAPPNAVMQMVPPGLHPPLDEPAGPSLPGGMPDGVSLTPGEGMQPSGVPRLRTSAIQPPPEMAALSPENVPPQENLPSQPSLVFRTRDVVRPDVLRGKNYRLAEYAPLVDYQFRFEIETPWGTIPAHGMAMLDLRLRELHALEYGSRIARKNPMFVEGVVRAALATPEGAFILATDPVDSVRRTAYGLKRVIMAGRMPGGRCANCESRRRIACLIGCDPETHNPPLDCLLDSMSTSACAGWLGVDAALNLALPGLGALPANAEFKRMMMTRSTREIQALLDGQLLQLGIPEAARSKFRCSESFTTTQAMIFVYYLRKLVGVENLSSLVEGAGDAQDESEALTAIQEVQLLAEIRRTRGMSRVSFVGLPTVRMDSGSQLIVCANDYLVESPRLAELITRCRGESPGVPTTLVTLGRVSVDAQRQLELAGISVACQPLAKAEGASHAERPLEAASKPQNESRPGPRTQL